MANKLKVMQVIGAARPGGAETFYVRLIKAFEQSDLDIEILPVVRTGSWVAAQLDAAGISYESAPFGGRLDLRTRKILKRCIAGWQPDIIQTWMNRASRFVPKVPIPKVARLGGYYSLRYYRKHDHLIGNTEDICQYLRAQGWPAERAHYIPNFADVPPAGFENAREETRRRYSLAPDTFVALLAGRLHTNKGFDVALAALRLLPADVHVLLVGGEGPQKEELTTYARDHGLQDRLTFVGWVDDISPLAAAADVWLVPSRHEPLGNTVLDAWAHRVPVVAARSAGPASLIRDGEDGLLVPLEDAEALAAATRRVKEDQGLREHMTAEGWQTFCTKFTKEVILRRYMDFFWKIKREHDAKTAKL
jgi:glycosyltransferase involved in cell wall biosynthesis